MADLLVSQAVSVEVCDRWWQPIDLVQDPVVVECVSRVCDVGTGKLDAPATAWNRRLLAAGSTVVVSAGGRHVQAGWLREFGEDRASRLRKVSWIDTLGVLGRMQAAPNPDTETGQGPQEYDTRAGYASSVVLGFVAANAGPSAPAWKRVPGLVVGADPQTGQWLSAPVQARWHNLLDLVRSAAMSNGLVFDVTVTDRDLIFQVRPIADLSASIVFEGPDFSDLDWSVKAPEATRVLGMGTGEGPARTVQLVTSEESREQETRWGRPAAYVHWSSSADGAALESESLRQLGEKGESVEVLGTLATDRWRLGTDYRLGDLVTVEDADLSVVRPVREVSEAWDASSGHTVRAVVGDYQATSGTGAAFKAREVLRVIEQLKVRA